VLTTDEEQQAPVVRAVTTRLTGMDREPGQVLRWFGLVDRADASSPAKEDYKAIEESVPVMAREVADELLDDLAWQREDVTFLLPPQLSATMTTKIVDHLEFPGAKEISCVADTGNNGNALVFFQLERLLPAMGPADKAIAVAIESSKWIKSGLAIEA
jgi:3-oxoacyl-[acyl-carrier-protein] synthase III